AADSGQIPDLGFVLHQLRASLTRVRRERCQRQQKNHGDNQGSDHSLSREMPVEKHEKTEGIADTDLTRLLLNLSTKLNKGFQLIEIYRFYSWHRSSDILSGLRLEVAPCNSSTSASI